MKPTLESHRDFAADNLRDAALILDMLGLVWWIEAGTFLGAVRERGHFIKHDTDLDIGVLMSFRCRPEQIIAGFEKLGFSVHHIYGKPWVGYEISVKRNDIKLDLFFFYSEGGTLWHAAWYQEKMIRLEFPHNAIFPLSNRTVEGVTVTCPRKPEAYLTLRYGEDWRTPKTKWRWWYDPKCINWEKSEITFDENAEPIIL